MREFSTPRTVEAPVSGNLTDDVFSHAAEAPSAVLFHRRREGAAGATPGDDDAAVAPPEAPEWDDVSAAAFHAEVRAVAKGLIAAGIEPGDRVALMSRTRYEWTLLDYAIWFAGAVTVPVYETSSPDQVAWVLGDSGARAVLVETHDHLARIAQVRGRLDELHHVWALDDNALGVLRSLGEEVGDDQLDERRTAAGPNDLATIIYTSGTTGDPRGCMLTHGNFMVELAVATEELEQLFAADDACTLLFLPLAHVFARIVQVGCVRSRTPLAHGADVTRLEGDLRSYRPTFLLAVPRIFEKLFNTASQRATADGRGGVFDRAAEVAISYSRGLDRGRPSVAVRAQHAVLSRTVHARLRAVLGGRCAYVVSGGAPLGERLGHFYRGIGVTVLEGYGLTETTAAITVNVPEALKIGTVGRPLPGTTVRVADDGELLVRGGQVFVGYWGAEEETARVLTSDGWLHTDDVGEIDDEGFVRVTGRKKEILVTAGGKNVAPTVLEDRLRAHPLVSQALVVGDGQPFVAALVTVDEDAWPAWAKAHGKRGAVAAHLEDADLLAAVQTAVDEANSAVSKAEAIRRFRVLGSDWTEEGGHLTPSLKLRRAVVTREFRDDIAALYR